MIHIGLLFYYLHGIINFILLNSGMLNKIGICHSKLLTPKCKSLYGSGVMMQKLLQTEKTNAKHLKNVLKQLKNSQINIWILKSLNV